jgi:Cd2+/Zn2+-exporting ATPase
VPLAEAVVGDRALVRPGERIPLDGVIRSGASALDESPITGESVPADKGPSDTVYAGSLNTSGLLEVEVTALVADSTLARVVFLVEEAQASRAPVQRLVDRFTRWYTPVVIGFAVVVAFGVPAAAAVLGTTAQWGGLREWFYRGLVLLVVSCPCALVISTPVAIVSAITRASRDGVLVKGGAVIEAAARVAVVAFDKTGTLTEGRPAVVAVRTVAEGDATRVLALAAALESGSNHPVARAVVTAAEARGMTIEPVSEYEELPGRGVRGVVAGRRTMVGSPAFVGQSADLGADLVAIVEAEAALGRTVLALVSDDGTAGLVSVADEIRPGARDAVDALRRGGVDHLVMLTGDNEAVAAGVAAHLGLTEHMSGLLPADKVDAVRRLRERHGSVAMVGDGVNDAPALATANVGIAMGAVGSDTALETADVALMTDDLSALPGFLKLARRTVADIRQNVVFSVAVKLVVLTAAVFGYANLWMAVFADTGVSLLVTANGLRLLRRGRRGNAEAPGSATPARPGA